MQITQTRLDDLNSTLTISLERQDFAEKVQNRLKDHRKKANIPGFRKGFVPMGLIKKQYETGVTVDEVNKLLQENIGKYISEKKLELLGHPLPKGQEGTDWKADTLSFEFEIGLSPKIEVNLKKIKGVTEFQIEADQKMVNQQIESIKKQYSTLKTSKKITKGVELLLEVKNQTAAIDTSPTIKLDELKDEKNIAIFIASKLGDVLELKTKNLFKEDAIAARFFGVTINTLNELPETVSVIIKEINERILPDLNQELFDKIYEPGTITSETSLKAKIKEDIEKQFESQSEQKLLNDIGENLVKNIKFDLPKEFLIRWMQNSGKQPLTEEKAKEEYEKSENGIRHQLIEGAIIKENKLKVEFEELQSFAKELIKKQMVQYGKPSPKDKELNEIVARIFANQDETKKLSDQLMSKKLLSFYKEAIGIKIRKVSYDDFIKEAYSKKE